MFYSQLLLSKKGALGVIWIAAHCYSKLKKDQVQRTNISSSVDKILVDEVPMVAHRILAYLLIGVVRIYSKKVDYLFDDCNDMLKKLLSDFKIRKRDRPACEASIRDNSTAFSKRHKRSEALEIRDSPITLPMRFELDVFDLGPLEDQDVEDENVRPREELMLKDGWREEASTSSFLHMDNLSFSQDGATAYTPPRDVLSPHLIDEDRTLSLPCNMKNSWANQDIFRETSFSLEDRMEPMILDDDETEEMRDKSSYNRSEAVENLVDHSEPTVLDGAEKERNNCRPSVHVEFDFGADPSEDPRKVTQSLATTEHEPEKEGTNHTPSNEAELDVGVSPSEEPQKVTELLDTTEDEPEKEGNNGMAANDVDVDFVVGPSGESTKVSPGTSEQMVSAENRKLPEKITYSRRSKKTEERAMSITVDVTPNSKHAGAEMGTPLFAAVETPAPKERSKSVSKKRRVLFDTTKVVLRDVYKTWLDDPNDLTRKKNKVPHTRLQVWRAHKLRNIHQSFTEPLFSGISADLQPLELNRRTFKKLRSQIEVKSPVAQEDQEQDSDVESPRSREQIPVVQQDNEEASNVRSPRSSEQPPATEEDNEQASNVRPSRSCEQPPATEHAKEQASDVIFTHEEPPVTQISHEEIPIAPGTPVTCLNSLPVTNTDILPSSSMESMENVSSTHKGLELDADFLNEANSPDEDSSGKRTHSTQADSDIYSARTRMAEKYLQKNLLHNKRHEKDEVLSLSKLLAGKTKKESAGLFYEILVLKTRDRIDVQQEKPYSDIQVRERTKSNPS